MDDIHDMKFSIRDLQCQILRQAGKLKAAKTVLKQAIFETSEPKFAKWHYHFVMRRAELYANEGDFSGCYSVLQSGIDDCNRKNNIDMKVGKVKGAIQALTELHKSLEREPKVVAPQTVDPGSSYPSPNTTNGVTQVTVSADGHGDRNKSTVPIQLLPRNKLYALVYLISGIANKPSETYKSKKFFIEGLKAVNNEDAIDEVDVFDVGDVIESKGWWTHIKALMMRQLAEVCILRTEYDEAQQEEAIVWFHTAMSSTKTHSVGDADLRYSVDNNEISSLAKLNLMFLLLAGNEREHAMACSMLDDINTQTTAVPLETHRALKALGEGFRASSNGEIKNTKVHLLESLKLSETLASAQLKSTCLTMLGNLFMDTESAQAEKMFNTAYAIAKKSKNEIFAALCGRLLADLSGRKGEGEKVSKFKQAEAMHMENVMNGWNKVCDTAVV
ncbi:hypothetical protein HK102_009700 [Quaeritorhiza haematococci]|nr:hypothetical protein HK102_009700 [Quaeritorhiza haematococci]